MSSHPATALVGTASDTQEALHLDFATGQPAHRRYARAKVIDQIFYIEGQGDPRAPD